MEKELVRTIAINKALNNIVNTIIPKDKITENNKIYNILNNYYYLLYKKQLILNKLNNLNN